jgi:hypothetical protein
VPQADGDPAAGDHRDRAGRWMDRSARTACRGARARRDDCPPGMTSRSFAAPGRCRDWRPCSGVMKQVREGARIAVGDLYDLGAA